MIGLKITGLQRSTTAARPYYVAVVVNGDLEVPVNRRFGSWQTDAGREVLPPVAAMLQHAVYILEKAEAKAAKVPAPSENWTPEASQVRFTAAR